MPCYPLLPWTSTFLPSHNCVQAGFHYFKKLYQTRFFFLCVLQMLFPLPEWFFLYFSCPIITHLYWLQNWYLGIPHDALLIRADVLIKTLSPLWLSPSCCSTMDSLYHLLPHLQHIPWTRISLKTEIILLISVPIIQSVMQSKANGGSPVNAWNEHMDEWEDLEWRARICVSVTFTNTPPNSEDGVWTTFSITF